jgi:hypothetical protein
MNNILTTLLIYRIFQPQKRISNNYEESPWEQCTGKKSKLEQIDMHPLFCPVFSLEQCLQECASCTKWKNGAQQKVYIGHLHH